MKPTLLMPQFAGIPTDLTATSRWVLWKLVYNEAKQRWDKVPYGVSGLRIDITQPASWHSFADVQSAYADGKIFDGVGFVIDMSDEIVGIDIDKLEEHADQPEVKWIKDALRMSGTYAEWSPSGKGVRVFLKATLPFAGKNNRKLGIEIYGSDRYLTVTGHRLKKAGPNIVQDQGVIDKIVAIAFPSEETLDARPPSETAARSALTDDELLTLARGASNGREFALLYDGKLDEYYASTGKAKASHSDSDFALCCRLAFWSGKDHCQMDRLFRGSGLMRNKWDERHGETTYGKRTITKAIERCDSVYTPREAQQSALRTINLSTVIPVALEWLWPGFVPLGKVTLIAGNPGLGKSQITLDLAARVSGGGTWPTGESATSGRVILICGEDDVADTIVPRLNAAGADLNQIEQVASVKDQDTKGRPIDRALSLQRDLALLEVELRRNPDTRLAVIDPISAYLGSIDSHNNAETRALLEPLARMAQQYRVAVVLVSHLNKGSGEAIYRTSGSIAFVAAARAAFIVAMDDHDSLQRHLLPTKSNLSKDSVGIGFRIEVAPNGAPYVRWDTHTVAGDDLERLLNVTPADERPRLQEAMAWLADQLANGPVPSKQIHTAAKKEGIALRTLDRAKAKLKVEAKKIGAAWDWVLPPLGAPIQRPPPPAHQPAPQAPPPTSQPAAPPDAQWRLGPMPSHLATFMPPNIFPNRRHKI